MDCSAPGTPASLKPPKLARLIDFQVTYFHLNGDKRGIDGAAQLSSPAFLNLILRKQRRNRLGIIRLSDLAPSVMQARDDGGYFTFRRKISK
jgi:hypothetical protein